MDINKIASTQNLICAPHKSRAHRGLNKSFIALYVTKVN